MGILDVQINTSSKTNNCQKLNNDNIMGNNGQTHIVDEEQWVKGRQQKIIDKTMNKFLTFGNQPIKTKDTANDGIENIIMKRKNLYIHTQWFKTTSISRYRFTNGCLWGKHWRNQSKKFSCNCLQLLVK